MNNQKLCCVAGKSGGHILPCLQFAKDQYTPDAQLIFISTTSTLDATVLKPFALTDHLALYLPSIPYKAFWRLPIFCVSTLRAFVQSVWYLKTQKPDRIISTGGFIGLPVCLAAWILRIPIDLFELNAVPGKATVALSMFATRIFICFQDAQKAFKKPCLLTNYPIRFRGPSLPSTTLKLRITETLRWTEQDKTPSQHTADINFAYSSDKKTILILGGSQGSEFLNATVQTLPQTLLSSCAIIHQTGQSSVAACTAFYKARNVTAHVFAYELDLAPYYQMADLIVCRAGAGTLFETMFFRKPCIIIPLETATTDHQLDNAYAIQNMHPELVTVVRQNDIRTNPELFSTCITSQLANQAAMKNTSTQPYYTQATDSH